MLKAMPNIASLVCDRDGDLSSIKSEIDLFVKNIDFFDRSFTLNQDGLIKNIREIETSIYFFLTKFFFSSVDLVSTGTGLFTQRSQRSLIK